MRNRRVLGGLGLAVGSALLFACSAAPDDTVGTGSEAALTEGAFIQDNSPYYWATSSFDEFRAATASLAPQSPVLPALAEDDPLTIRMQAWLDRVDAVVRPAMEAKLGAPLVAPKPLARVLQSRSTFNAWVSGVPACLGTPLGASGVPGTAVYLQSANTQLATVPGAGVTCLKEPAWSADGAVKFWNAGKPACALSLADGALKAGGTGCTIDPNGTSAADVMITSTGNYVQFTTDLLAQVDENTVAVVAAHELGHYYLGHATERGAANYGFWYTRDDARKTTPVRASNSADLEAAYKEVIQAGRPLGGPSFASHFSARMRPLLLSGIAPILTARTETDFVCAAARDALGPWTQQIIQGEAPPQDAQKSFVDFEAKLVKCAPHLALTGDPSATSISAGTTLVAGSHYRPGPKAKITLTFGDNLGAFLDRIDTQAKALDAKADKLVKRLQDNRIGLYTIEQAADEFAMQMASKMGFTTDEILAGWVDFMRAIDRLYARSFTPDQLATWRQQSAELDADSCAALMAANFMKDGARVTVNMGQLDEPHHTSCYRLYNLWREGRAHSFVPGARLPALAPEWDTLKSEAASLASQAQL
jgi:Zn-dependent protease with chaperone function